MASRLDEASLNIAEKLREKYGLKELKENVYARQDVQLIYIDVGGVYISSLTGQPNVDGIVFASRHRSESGKPTLTVHVPGNPLQDTSMGGRPKELAWAWPQRMRNALLKLTESKSNLSVDYKVSLEATHHGPTCLEMPVWFVEIGSTEKHWNDNEAGAAVAEAIWSSVTQPPSGRCAVGFGGGHYAPKHTESSIDEGLAVGHIFAKYTLQRIDLSIVAEAFRKTFGGCRTAVIDWKGMKSDQRRYLLESFSSLGVEEVIKI